VGTGSQGAAPSLCDPDTIAVRSVLVTALTLDIGGRMWWPSGLAQARTEVNGGLPGEAALRPHQAVP